MTPADLRALATSKNVRDAAWRWYVREEDRVAAALLARASELVISHG
jgi:hypothetical protein